ncbi:hypothetical protein K7432_017062, partial [Basidiobolus ranarum]
MSFMNRSAEFTVEAQPQSIHSIRARNVEQLNLHTNILLKSIISSEKARERRLQFLNKIQHLINTHFPDKQITAHLFGSSITGLDFGGSDCDVALETEWNDNEVNVNALARILRFAGMRYVTPIAGARVPIVKFYDPEYCISCDINVNNILGLHNSQMITAYLSIDDRVKKLIMLIKYWAKRRGINSASGGTYSSYCYVLMAIFFLQNLDEPILPSLQQISQELDEEGILIPILVNQRFKKRRKKQVSSNMSYADVSYFKELHLLSFYFRKPYDSTLPSVLELFIQFCEFYLRIIESSDVISIRTGRLIAMKEIWMSRGYLLHVEDPFDLERNVASTASICGEAKIVQEMERVTALFQAGNCTIETLFEKIEERSLNLKSEPTNILELIQNERHKLVLPTRKYTKPAANNNLRKSQKTRNMESTKSPSGNKTKAHQKVTDDLFSMSEPAAYTGYASTILIGPNVESAKPSSRSKTKAHRKATEDP